MVKLEAFRLSAWQWLSVVVLSFCTEAVEGSKAPFVVEFQTSQRQAAPVARKLSRRASPNPITTNTSSVFDDGGLVSFHANVSVGTPPQSVSMLVDTNSADLAFIGANDPVCNSTSSPCDNGIFRTADSSSYKYLNHNYTVTFGDGTNATGDYAKDTIIIGGFTVDEQQIAVARKGTLAENILGIGYVGLETANDQYANLPITLYNNGDTDIVGYSIWFDDADSQTGKVVFGGVDTGKFNGTLETIPISMEKLTYDYVTVKMSAITVTSGKESTNISTSPISVVADSGTTIFYLATDIVDSIGKAIGATYDDTVGSLVIKYKQMDNDTTIDLTFGGTAIQIPLDHFVFSLNDTYAGLYISPSGDDTLYTIGVPFFRNTYTVFDYSHNQISLAPVVYSSTSNITLIGENGVGQLSSTAEQSGSSSANSTSGGDNNNGGSGLSSSAKIGIGIGVGVGVPLLLVLAAGLFFWNKRRKAAAAPALAPVDDKQPEDRFGKSELPADGVAGNAATATQGRKAELEGNTAPAAAELQDHQSQPPQELPASFPEPRELPGEQQLSDTNANSSTVIESSPSGKTAPHEGTTLSSVS